MLLITGVIITILILWKFSYETELISSMSTTSTTVDVTSTRDFPNEGLLMMMMRSFITKTRDRLFLTTVQEDLMQ